MSSYQIIGIMSGTSMDGVDISCCSYSKDENNAWSFSIKSTDSFSFPAPIFNDLTKSTQLSAVELLILNKKLGQLFARFINSFLQENNINKNRIDAIASHGHTIFHQPENGFTYQIGCGDTISTQTGIKVINDFRQKDVVLGGQGAPLVPIGDLLLFNDLADSFLNIGGFTNISFPIKPTIAFDICPGNLPLNRIMNEIGLDFDDQGKMSRSGEIDKKYFQELNKLPFYHQNPPKSLGTEWLESHFNPIIEKILLRENKLRTITEHIAFQVAKKLTNSNFKTIAITGGGAKNSFLIERIKSLTETQVIIPNDELIDFKEAIVFGFLGALYLDKSTNIMSTVTGAEYDSIGGVLHIP